MDPGHITVITSNPGLIPRDIAISSAWAGSLAVWQEAEQGHSARLRSDVGDASSDGRQGRPMRAQMVEG